MEKKENLFYPINIVLLTASIIFTGLNFAGKRGDREKKNNLIAALLCMSVLNLLNTLRSNND